MAQAVDGTLVRFSTKQRGAASKTITAITLIENPVVTSTAHGLANGDVIDITGSSYKDLNRLHTVAVVDENSFILAGFDLSKVAAIITHGSFKTVVMTQFCDVTNIEVNEYEVSSENKNTVCRKGKSFKVELGSISLDFESYDDSELQNMLRNSGKKLEPLIMQLQRPESYALRGYYLQVTSFNETGDVEGDWEGSLDTELLSLSQDVDMTPNV